MSDAAGADLLGFSGRRVVVTGAGRAVASPLARHGTGEILGVDGGSVLVG